MNQKYYIVENEHDRTMDIMKRDGVRNEDGTLSPEKVCSVHSVEYLQPILDTLNAVDTEDTPHIMPIHDSPIREEW